MKILIADTETTGLGKDAAICEYAHLECELTQDGLTQQLVVVNEVESLINPCMPIPKEASNVHHITDAMVADAPLITDVLPAHVPQSSRIDVIGHNFVAYDMQYLHRHYPEHINAGCSLRATKRYLPGQKSHSLDKLRVALDLPKVQAHAALGDCYTVLHILNQHILAMGMPWEEVLDVMMERPTIMPWGKHKGTPIADLDDEYVAYLLTEEHVPLKWDLKRALLER